MHRLQRSQTPGHTQLQQGLEGWPSAVCKELLVRRLTAKRGTVLLEARGWPGKGMGWAAGPKIGCGGGAEKDGGTVVGGSAPAPPAGKKRPEESQGHP
ncbi:uncharacterized protein BDCG_01589 [Blastomyces dermatitidis ER-3]|uniref:Uncharacterized protein n=1 Tax=Ajellomyces dermatitidis (strain ER-3 / ATCC MYA-2586) TaxID=559297 RepID=A0ABP2ESX4_AJEDR|nr:uncharacterized protein BDCG_01589 [Blastomyces dermatitidis ER-3]EEQ86469.2 hypothetical protein BDCG_01589 [Blastomyces dermatitidis ER-3]